MYLCTDSRYSSLSLRRTVQCTIQCSTVQKPLRYCTLQFIHFLYFPGVQFDHFQILFTRSYHVFTSGCSTAKGYVPEPRGFPHTGGESSSAQPCRITYNSTCKSQLNLILPFCKMTYNSTCKPQLNVNLFLPFCNSTCKLNLILTPVNLG